MTAPPSRWMRSTSGRTSADEMSMGQDWGSRPAESGAALRGARLRGVLVEEEEADLAVFLAATRRAYLLPDRGKAPEAASRDKHVNHVLHVNMVSESRNITLTLDESTLREARVLAAERGLSVSAFLRQELS